MRKHVDPDNVRSSTTLNDTDNRNINALVAYTLNDVQLLMMRIGGLLNMLAALFAAYVLYGKITMVVLYSWLIALVCLNTITILFAVYFKKLHVPPDKIAPWRNGYRLLLCLLCLTWGSVGIMFTASLHYQLFTMTLLLFALVGFSFGTIADFTASAIAIVCVTLPYIAYRFYSVLAPTQTGYDPRLDFDLSISLSILALFLLAVTYVGYRLVNYTFKTSLINLVLTKKLAVMNAFLEDRFQDRTHELENSLKLVTYQSTHDLLTDLPNQRLLIKYIELAINTSSRNHHLFAIASLSINELEKINDVLGYTTGEAMIKTVTNRFNQRFNAKIDTLGDDKLKLRKTVVTLSRKDTFIILMYPILPEEIRMRGEKLFSVLSKPIDVGNQAITLSASVGICLYPTDGRDINSLLMHADAAMLKAKQHGGNHLHIYEAGINADFSRQLQVENHLHSALKKQELTLVYQPFIDANTHRIRGVETLIRWCNPALGNISPLEFIPIANASGLIIPIGEWILRTACEQVREWHKQGYKGLPISVNLSSKQLVDKNIMQMIARILDHSGLPPQCLELELTETEAFQADLIPILNHAKDMGLSLSIDDFGVGYSWLGNLKLFDIDKLKIDKSFMDDVITNKDSKTIVTHTIKMAKKLHITVLAEGVETKQQLDFLRQHGCDLIQGYLFSRPVSAAAFTKLLEKDKLLKMKKQIKIITEKTPH